MAKSFRELYNKLSAEDRREVEESVGKMLHELALNELREARHLTQVQLAKKLRTNQGAVSKLEKRADMYVSTLEKVVRAMGGELQFRAIFPTGEVHLLKIPRPRKKIA